MLPRLCVRVAIVFWKCYVLRPRRNFPMARRPKKQRGNDKNDYARLHAAAKHVSVIEGGAPHSGRE